MNIFTARIPDVGLYATDADLGGMSPQTFADVARDIAADIRRDLARLPATHPDVLRLVKVVNTELFVPPLIDMIAPGVLADCETAADVADAIDAAALEWEEIVAEGDDYDDGDDW